MRPFQQKIFLCTSERIKKTGKHRIARPISNRKSLSVHIRKYQRLTSVELICRHKTPSDIAVSGIQDRNEFKGELFGISDLSDKLFTGEEIELHEEQERNTNTIMG
ncbi:unnamed protein product [Fraxinus pennsylvanica]|uniref:Uncharacterized protein n=1 Tax=Fraxinus pennsylvanica TaxID=56036 RepID=A0AAD1ZMY6_9LAMI|nr:unnamed protein product [Fraxinus pennsylvanica]